MKILLKKPCCSNYCLRNIFDKPYTCLLSTPLLLIHERISGDPTNYLNMVHHPRMTNSNAKDLCEYDLFNPN